MPTLTTTETPFISYGIEIITIIFLRFGLCSGHANVWNFVLLLCYELAYLYRLQAGFFVWNRMWLCHPFCLHQISWLLFGKIVNVIRSARFTQWSLNFRLTQTRFEWILRVFQLLILHLNCWTHLNLKWAPFLPKTTSKNLDRINFSLFVQLILKWYLVFKSPAFLNWSLLNIFRARKFIW